jgi:hypothetical protein
MGAARNVEGRKGGDGAGINACVYKTTEKREALS